jgi:hypothetical protein
MTARRSTCRRFLLAPGRSMNWGCCGSGSCTLSADCSVSREINGAGPRGEQGPPARHAQVGLSGPTIRDWKIDRALRRDARHERRQRWPAARIARTVRAIFLGGAMTDQSRGERKSPRTMTPELLAARITLRVAELRLLAAWTSVLAGRVRPPEGSRRVPRLGGPTPGR